MRNIIVALLLAACLAIDQPCPCPANSNCLMNNMCACNQGFVADCTIPAQSVGQSVSNVQLNQGQTVYVVVEPIQLDHFLEFTFNFCLTQPLSLTLTFFSQNGQNTGFNSENQLVNPSSGLITTGCSVLKTPYISFTSQPNGQDVKLVLAIQSSSQNASISLSVTQNVVIGVFLYYYVVIAIIVLVAIIILVGVGFFIYKKRVRRGTSAVALAVNNVEPYNNIEHFQNFMPLFPASQLGNQPGICPICLQQIEAAEVVRQTPCRHVFHPACIDAWGMKNMSCPVCRFDLSLSRISAALRDRNSLVEMELPPEDDDEWEDPGVTNKSRRSRKKTFLLGLQKSQKTEIRENML